MNACDAGREGELIFREILEFLESDKPTKRLWLQSMTQDSIRNGFRTLVDGSQYDGLGAAASCRSKSDWLIGMNATRALTRRLKGRKEKTAWSAGRVQTPTLAIVVDRELEILAHVARPYWQLHAKFQTGDHEYQGTWFDPTFSAPEGEEREQRDDRIFEVERANALLETLDGQAGRGERDAQAEPRDGAAALRPDEPAARGQPALRLVGAAHAERGAALLRGAQAPDLSAHRLALPAQRLPREGRPGDRDVRRRRPVPGRGRAARSRTGSRTPSAPSTTPRSPTTSRSSRPARLPDANLSGDDQRLFDLVTRRFLASFHPRRGLDARRARDRGRRASRSARARARSTSPAGAR